MTAVGRPGLSAAAPWVAVGLAAMAALLLGWTSLQRHVRAACDGLEWPYFSSCPRGDGPVPEQVRAMQARIAVNPGDSTAWLALALLTTQPGGVAPLDDDAVLATATRVAGENPMLQRVLAARALEREAWPEAVTWLVRLVQDHGDGDAARALAALVPRPEAQAALQAALKPGTTWLAPVLGSLASVKVPAVLAMPLVAQALPLKLVSPQTGQALMRDLKARGDWQDAHALWLALVGGEVPLIFNGEFEQGFIANGFDWELRDTPPTLAGAWVQQPQLGAQGRVLQVEFTGRPVALPVVRQVLMLQDGDYTFTGRFMARQMRTEQGLTWTFTCVAGGRELARTPALADTQGQWRALDLALTVPPDCGGAVALQLQTQLGSEALAGLRGQMAFDGFRLVPR
jgi:hypothetical protein